MDGLASFRQSEFVPRTFVSECRFVPKIDVKLPSAEISYDRKEKGMIFEFFVTFLKKASPLRCIFYVLFSFSTLSFPNSPLDIMSNIGSKCNLRWQISDFKAAFPDVHLYH